MRRSLCTMSKSIVDKRSIRQSTLDELFAPKKLIRIEKGDMTDVNFVDKRETLAAAALTRSTRSPNTNNSDWKEDEPSSSTKRDETDVVEQGPGKVEAHVEKNHSMGPDLNSFPAHRTPPKLPPLKSSADHTVCINVKTVNRGTPPAPYPSEYVDRWDCNHVYMPCSPMNKYPDPVNHSTIVNRWPLIEKALRSPIKSSIDLEEAILSYNSRYKGKHMWKFRELHRLCNDIMTIDQLKHLFDVTIPGMVDLALRLPQICTTPIKMLKNGMNHSVTLSQEQIACLLAHAFFSTFPGRNQQKESATYPQINFNGLMDTNYNGQKLICILHYFKRVIEQMPTGCVTFTRRSFDKTTDWITCDKKLTQLHVSQLGTIEDYGTGMLQMDFANKFIGGGVLRHGCVQEEIRFLICPEMIASLLFTEVMGDNECLIMTGCERFSLYSGYADTFLWDAPFVDETPRDAWGRRVCTVVAMDASCFYSPLKQFSKYFIDRELNKAYVSFYTDKSALVPAVATGNWGCGAFNGDKQFKSLIQLLAAAQNGRDVVFFTFSDAHFMEQLYSIHKFLCDKKLGIGEIYMILLRYNDKCVKGNKRPSMTIFDFIYSLYTDNTESDRSSSVKDNPIEDEFGSLKGTGIEKETVRITDEKITNCRFLQAPQIDEFSSPEKESEEESVSTPKKSVFDAIIEDDKGKN